MTNTKKLGLIKRTSLSGEAAKKLKENILAGQIPPGSYCIADEIAKKFGISRTPVRDAFHELASSGLLIYDGKSYMVANYSAKDVRELYAIRRILEVYAIQEAIAHLTPNQISQFRHTYERTEKRIREKGDDVNLMIKLDEELHQLIYSGSKNERLKIILQEIREKLSQIHNWGHIMRRGEYIESAKIEEYGKFLSSLESRDAEKAAHLMEQHLTAGEEFTLVCLGFSENTSLSTQQDSALAQSKENK